MGVELAILSGCALMAVSNVLNALIFNWNITKVERERREFAEAQRLQAQIDQL